MIETAGGRWAMTSDPITCPGCGASWQGEAIPEASRPSFGGATHFRRCIAVYGPEVDRTVGWGCPDCKRLFDRVTLAPTGKTLPG
jgi:rubredoxin